MNWRGSRPYREFIKTLKTKFRYNKIKKQRRRNHKTSVVTVFFSLKKLMELAQ